MIKRTKHALKDHVERGQPSDKLFVHRKPRTYIRISWLAPEHAEATFGGGSLSTARHPLCVFNLREDI